MRLRRKLLLIMIATSAVTALALGLGAFRILAGAVKESTIERLSSDAALLATLSGAVADPGALATLATSAGQRLGVRVTFVALDGRVLADSWTDAAALARMDNHLHRPEIQQALVAGRGQSHRVSDTTHVDYFYLAQHVPGPGAAAFARVALPRAELERFEAHHLVVLSGATLASFLVLSVLAWFVVGRLVRPVERMSEAADLVARGALAETVPEPAEEELGRLGRSVNRMKQALVAKIEELESEQRFLETMREGLGEGLLLVGAGHRVVMDNGAFRRIFRIGVDPIGRLLGEVVRHPAVVKLVDEAVHTGQEARDTVHGTPGSDQAFEVHARPVEIPGGEGARGVLVLFFDVTRLEALERVRRQFVADVSHELRTPVTSIKGAIETLLDGDLVDGAEARRFLEIAHRQAGRMAELISDLTDLSLIETGAVRLDVQSVDLAEVAADVVAVISQRYPDRQVDLRSEVPAGFLVKADRRRLEQILINLLDNGVKFNRPKGWVRIAAERSEGTVRITVEDSGTGIPPDSLDKIFQRFYRVDRARSREAGGTGLGLAIVKHLVHLHGGEVLVESTLGQGSRFTIELLSA